jgi:hypothetical protein
MLRLLAESFGEFLIGKAIERILPDGPAKNRFDDPVYKKNLERLIERHRQFEKKE